MQVADVLAYALSSPIDPPQDRPFHGGTRRLLKRDVVLVVVETADGTRGVATGGASSSAMREYFEGDSQGTLADVVAETVAPALEGETFETVAAAHDAVDGTDLPARLRAQAASAVDVALHDVRGKELGAPVSELLAARSGADGAPDDELPLYASAGMYQSPEGYAEQAALVEEAGFAGYKYRPGIGPDADRRTVDLVTDAVEDAAVMLDAHTWWKLREPYGDGVVHDLVDHAAARGARWVEEPVAPDDYEGYRRLARTTGAPLAGGESEPSPEGLLDLADTGAVSFLQGDVRHHRGFTGCLAAAEYCAGRAATFVPHNFGTWLGLIANAHLVAAAPGASLLEYPLFAGDPLVDVADDPGMYPFELAFDVLAGEPDVEDGRLAVPDGPGLGVEVDLDVVERYPFVEGPWTEFHYDE